MGFTFAREREPPFESPKASEDNQRAWGYVTDDTKPLMMVKRCLKMNGSMTTGHDNGDPRDWLAARCRYGPNSPLFVRPKGTD